MLTLGQLTLGLLTLGHCQRAPALVGPTCSGSKSATPTAADLNPAVSPAGLTHQLLWCVVFVSSCEAQAAWLSTSHGVSDRAACPPETWPASRSVAGRRSRNTSAAGRRVVVGARPHEQLRKLLVANFGETFWNAATLVSTWRNYSVL